MPKKSTQSTQSEPEVQDTKALNAEYDKAVIQAQWDQAKRLGLLDLHGDSINSDRPKE